MKSVFHLGGERGDGRPITRRTYTLNGADCIELEVPATHCTIYVRETDRALYTGSMHVYASGDVQPISASVAEDIFKNFETVYQLQQTHDVSAIPAHLSIREFPR